MNKKQVMITSLGNTLEWLDFGLFILMAPIIGAAFFPEQTTSRSTVEALLVFAIGFICRPLGGLLFGYYGDKHGRTKPLRFSVLVITVATLLIGLLPNYQSIGIFSTILFILIRLVQGISIGGEYSGVMIYLAETAPPNRRGLITSFAAMGANVGFFLATLSYVILKIFYSEEIIFSWAWRIPFLLAGIPGSMVLFYRFRLTETKVYSYLRYQHQIPSNPLSLLIKNAPFQVLKIIGLTCMSSSIYYVFFGYMPTYLAHYIHIPLYTSLIMQAFLLVAMLFFVPLAGLCGDYFSRKRMLILTAISIMMLAIPCFYLLQMFSMTAVMCSLTIAAVLSAFDQGNSLAAVVENCPENVRYTGVAFSYNLGMAIFGGSAPLVATLLTEKIGMIAPAYYLIFMAGVSFIAALTLLSHNQSFSALKKFDSSSSL